MVLVGGVERGGEGALEHYFAEGALPLWRSGSRHSMSCLERNALILDGRGTVGLLRNMHYTPLGVVTARRIAPD